MNRSIYSYCLPTGETRNVDPLEIDRLLARALKGDTDGVLARAEIPLDPDGKPLSQPAPQKMARFLAEEQLIDASVSVFALAPFDEDTGEGVLDQDVLGVLYAFLEWCAEKQQQHRDDAELCHWFPSVAPSLLEASGVKMDYHFRVGLHLNLPRIQTQLAALVASGTSIGTTNEDIDMAMADALARHPEEAMRILLRTNSARTMARAVSEKK